MKKVLILAFAFCSLVLGTGPISTGQDNSIRSAISAAPETNSREQDGLRGPVRRIRIETAKIVIKGGNLVEGPKDLRTTQTYDPSGRRVDSVAYNLEVIAKAENENYRHDDKGNIVELVFRGSDGSSFVKETFKYEFDQLGNWKKMVRSVAVYEDGKISYEPIEVTYRTIAYYYGEAIDKLATNNSKLGAASPNNPRIEAPAPSRIATSGANSRETETTGSVQSNPNDKKTELQTRVPAAQNAGNDQSSPAAASLPQKQLSAVPTNAAGPLGGNADGPISSKINVQFVTEDVLRSAAINLPKAEYPPAAGLSGAGGRVEVHIIVDERGNVVSARAMSGHALLKEAAEAAARKASFAREKLSLDPVRLYGVINYDFAPPPRVVSEVIVPTPTSTVLSESSPSTPASVPATGASTTETVAKEVAATDGATTSNIEAEPTPLEDEPSLKRAIQVNPNDVSSYIKLGLLYSVQKKHQDTVSILKTAIRIQPAEVGASTHYHLGYAYLNLNKFPEAVKSFQQALYLKRAESLNPEAGRARAFPLPEEVRYGLALAYNGMLRHRDAIRELKEVIALNPSLAEAHYSLAISYLAIKDRASAENQTKALRALDPKLADRIASELSTNQLLLLPCRGFGCR